MCSMTQIRGWGSSHDVEVVWCVVRPKNHAGSETSGFFGNDMRLSFYNLWALIGLIISVLANGWMVWL